MGTKITPTKDYELIARLNKPIHDLHVALYPQYFQEYNYHEICDSFQRFMTNEAFTFLLLENDDVPIGYVWIEQRIYPPNAFKKLYRSIYVHQISILNEQKQQGFGSQLMQHVYDIAMGEGISLIELDFWANNEQAKFFYEKHAFSRYREFMYRELQF